MLIEILRQTSIAGRPARVGDVVDLPEPDAAYFVASGKGKKAEVIDQPAPTRSRKPSVRT